MCVVEWCDIAKYSEGLCFDFTAVDLNPSCLLLTCPTLRQKNTYESWSINSGSTFCMLQSYRGYDIFCMSNDQPYVSKKALVSRENAWYTYH